MRASHRVALCALLFSIGMANPAFSDTLSSKHKHRHAAIRKAQQEPVITDSSSVAFWRKKLPWLYRDTSWAIYRDLLLRPLFKQYNLGSENLSKHGDFVEAVFPRGRPLHEYAYEVESLCAQAGIRVVEGHEFDPPEEHLEYSLQTASGVPFSLRLVLGKSILAGAARMALVVVSLDSVGDGAAGRLLSFPVSLTLAVAAGDSVPVPARWTHLPPGKEALLELPMEPSNYPYVKPGPGALFIQYSEEQVEQMLQAKLKTYPTAKGFATTYGDRAIENRPLVENTLRFTTAHSLVFLDLTQSPRSLTAAVALQTGATVFSARIQGPDSAKAFEAELLHRCELAGKTGEGVWVLRYFPGLPDLLENTLNKNRDYFEGMGLEWITLSSLQRRDSAGPGSE